GRHLLPTVSGQRSGRVVVDQSRPERTATQTRGEATRTGALIRAGLCGAVSGDLAEPRTVAGSGPSGPSGPPYRARPVAGCGLGVRRTEVGLDRSDRRRCLARAAL